MDIGLRGRKAIVTGATRGIGRCVAEMLAREGCDVAICARGAEGIEETLRALREFGVRADGRALNVRDGEAYRTWLAEACAALGGVDIVIANVSAGGGMDSERNWNRNFEIDLLGTVRAVDATLPWLRRSDAGSIVIMGTMAAAETFGGPMAYNAMKAALVTYSKQLSQALMPGNIRVNCVSPGPTEFEGSAWEMVRLANPRLYSGTLRQHPQRRMATAQEIANGVVFLASPAASWVTGAHLLIDGGFSKRVQF